MTFNSNPSLLSFIDLITYSNSKLIRACPCFNPSYILKAWDYWLVTRTLLWVSLKHIWMILINFSETPHSSGYCITSPFWWNHMPFFKSMTSFFFFVQCHWIGGWRYRSLSTVLMHNYKSIVTYSACFLPSLMSSSVSTSKALLLWCSTLILLFICFATIILYLFHIHHLSPICSLFPFLVNSNNYRPYIHQCRSHLLILDNKGNVLWL